jgi:hypothetical protein
LILKLSQRLPSSYKEVRVEYSENFNIGEKTAAKERTSSEKRKKARINDKMYASMKED